MDLVPSLTLSGMGVAVATVAFLNRDKPEWRRGMPVLMFLRSDRSCSGRPPGFSGHSRSIAVTA
ncbi:MAG: hypothetical protein ACJ77B_03385 [Chloroflexota bacterium]